MADGSAEKRPRVGPWHQSWKDFFPAEWTDAPRSSVRGGEGRTRIADIDVGGLVVEVQHSAITAAEIQSRAGAGKEVLWLLNATGAGPETACCMVPPCVTSRGHLLLFNRGCQLMAAFRRTSLTVLLHVDDESVYVVPLDRIRSGAAWVRPPHAVSEIAAVLRDPTRHAELLAGAPPAICRLTAIQDPPGSGKTHRLIRRCVLALDDGEFDHYQHVFVLTKPHSAKEVVYREFQAQLRVARDSGAVELLESHSSADGKGYRHVLRRRNGAEVTVHFSTVDALMCSLAPRGGGGAPPCANLFEGFARSIAQLGPRIVDPATGRARFRGCDVAYDARALICWDEATKLDRHYLHALAKVMAVCGADAVLAGDVMQSIESADNSLRAASSPDDADRLRQLLPFCDVDVQRGDEIRRFGGVLVGALCAAVDFAAYGVPVPRPANDVERESEGEISVHAVEAQRHEDPAAVARVVEAVFAQLLADVAELALLPHELLLVCPLVRNNPVGDELRDRLHEFWAGHLERPEVRRAAVRRKEGREFYDAYDDDSRRPRWLAYLHRSEEGRPVDTSLSEWASRAVSIHSSQGDGRRLVYVVGVSEAKLKCFTRGRSDVLEYAALWTVLMSRAKRRLRVFVEAAYDDAWRRLEPFMDEETRLRVEPTFRVALRADLRRADLAVDYSAGTRFGTSAAFEELQAGALAAIEAAGLEQEPQGAAGADDGPEPPELVEYHHHAIRMAIYGFAFAERLRRDERSEAAGPRRQVCEVLRRIRDLAPQWHASAADYHKALRGRKRAGEDVYELAHLPLWAPARLQGAQRAVADYVKQAQAAVHLLLQDREAEVDLDYKGCLVLHYLRDVVCNRNCAQTKMDVVLDVVDEPASRHDERLPGHYLETLQRARALADAVVSDGRIAGQGREWKLDHYLRLRTVPPRGEGEAAAERSSGDFAPCATAQFLGVVEGAAVVVLLTPRLDAMNAARVAGQALTTALLLERPDKAADVERLRGAGRRWLCVAPLGAPRPAWVDVDALLKPRREAAAAWLVGFLRQECRCEHEAIAKFYAWHLAAGGGADGALEAATAAVPRSFRGSYAHAAFETMCERADEEGDASVEGFSKALDGRLDVRLRAVYRALSTSDGR